MRRQRSKPLDGKLLARAADLDRIGVELRSQNVGEAREPPGRTGQASRPRGRRAFFTRQGEGNIRPAHGEAADHIANGLALAAVASKKLEAGRGGKEEIANVDAGALPQGRGLERGFSSAVHADRPGMRLVRMAARDGEPCHRADGGQGLTAKAQRTNVEEIVIGKLGCRVALDRERKVGGGHPGAVVGNLDQSAPSAVSENVDARRPCVQRVLDELLDHARRPLHHLAGGDAVDDCFRELANGHERGAEIPTGLYTATPRFASVHVGLHLTQILDGATVLLGLQSPLARPGCRLGRPAGHGRDRSPLDQRDQALERILAVAFLRAMALCVDHKHAIARQSAAGQPLEPRAHLRGQAR